MKETKQKLTTRQRTVVRGLRHIVVDLIREMKEFTATEKNQPAFEGLDERINSGLNIYWDALCKTYCHSDSESKFLRVYQIYRQMKSQKYEEFIGVK